MSHFADVLPIILEHEGGFVDNPADHGGPTKYGITAPTLAEFRGKPATAADVAALEPSEAEALYCKWWNDLRLDEVESFSVALAVFDQAVLDGWSSAVSRLQTILGIAVDGKMGTRTIQAVNREVGEALAFRFIRASVHHYTHLCEFDTMQVKFLPGWIDRLFSLIDHIFLEPIT